MRSIMRSTAEENKRNPTIAEGMVDEDVVLDSVKKGRTSYYFFHLRGYTTWVLRGQGGVDRRNFDEK